MKLRSVLENIIAFVIAIPFSMAIILGMGVAASHIPLPIGSEGRESWSFAFDFAKANGFAQNFTDEYNPTDIPFKNSRLSHNTLCYTEDSVNGVNILGSIRFKCDRYSSIAFNEDPNKTEGTIQLVINKKYIEAFTISRANGDFTKTDYNPDKISEKYGLKSIINREQNNAGEFKFWCNYYLKICFK